MRSEYQPAPGTRRRLGATQAAIGALLTALAAAAGASAPLCGPPLARAIPARASDAPGGSEFARRLARLAPHERQRAIERQLDAGNVPSFLRHLRPVLMPGPRPGARATICVSPDYLAVGSDRDFLRVPLSGWRALDFAGRHRFILPTRKMVDAIYRSAEIKLAPSPMTPGPAMGSPEYVRAHNLTIDRQGGRLLLGALVGGDKKDLVLSERLALRPDRVAIYGWHRLDGVPIQPLSTVHGRNYADYSHGVRLVSDTVWLDGQKRSVYDVLRDPRLAPLLTFEGTIAQARTIMRGRRPGARGAQAATARTEPRAAGPRATS